MSKIHLLGNEASLELKASMKKNQVSVRPSTHSPQKCCWICYENLEQLFLSSLPSTNPKFPTSEWDCLIPQAVITLNLLRNSRVNPNLSYHEYINNNFDFNATPLATPGTRVLIDSRSTTRKTWAAHREDGCYIGTSLKNYCCIKFYVPSTNTIQNVDTVKKFTQIPFPAVTLDYYLNQSATDIIAILQSTPPAVPPL